MANILFAHADLSDAASLGATSVNAAYPLLNLQDMQPSVVYRSANTSALDIDVDLGALTDVDFFALVNCNFTLSASVRVRTATTQANLTASPNYDSGAVTFTAPLAYANRGFYNKRAAVVNARWVRFSVADVANPAGFLEIGRLIVARAFVPARNYNFGGGIGFVDPTEISETLGGQLYVNARPRRKTMEFEIAHNASDSWVVLNNDRARGLAKEWLIIQDMDDTTNIHDRSIYGLMRELAPIVHTARNFYTKRYKIEEML